MYEVIKSVIMSGVFELNDMLRKIDTIWLQNQVTDDQRTDLIKLAQSNADPALSLNIMQMINALDERVTKLEGGSPAEAPEYKEGTVAERGKVYTWKGKKYRCIVPEGVVCVWSPDAMPSYWELVI